MASAADLTTESGKTVPALQLTPGLLLDRSIVINGPSGTGKSTLVKAIMWTLRESIEQVIVVAPTEPSNRTYEGFVAAPFIHYRLFLPDPKNPKKDDGVKGAVRFLEMIWDRSTMLASVYSRANQPEVLAQLFRRLPRPVREEGLRHIEAINARRQQILERFRARAAGSAAWREEKVKEINDKFRAMLVRLYKHYAGLHYEALWRDPALGEDERWSLAYLRLSPRLLLILDDCAAQLKTLFNREIWRKIFYQGRWANLTLILTTQDDTDLPTGLRKNAFITFFTEPVVCLSCFERASNKYPKPTKLLAAEIVGEVFRAKHRKLAYIREDDRQQNFYVFTAPALPVFRFGSSAVNELCEAVQSEGAALDKDNAFFSRFQL